MAPEGLSITFLGANLHTWVGVVWVRLETKECVTWRC